MFATRLLLIVLLAALALPGGTETNAQTPGERMAAEYFRMQTARIAARTLADVHTLADLRFIDLPQLVTLALPRSVNLTGADPGDWDWSLKAAKLLEGTITLP